MKIIKPSVEFFGEIPTDYENALKFIEMAGRTCYKSEDKITDTSAEGFVRRLIKSGHLAMVEHSNFVVRAKYADPEDAYDAAEGAGKYLTVVYDSQQGALCVGGNLTAWAQTAGSLSYAWHPFLSAYGSLFGLKVPYVAQMVWQVCPHDEIPKELHRYSAKFICDRGVSHELVRHRPCSFAQESTRYVNYGGQDMEFIEPAGANEMDYMVRETLEDSWLDAEDTYSILLNWGLKPQQARAVLPNALKTELITTADAAEWAHIRKLRTAKDAHPDIQRVMNMMPWETFL